MVTIAPSSQYPIPVETTSTIASATLSPNPSSSNVEKDHYQGMIIVQVGSTIDQIGSVGNHDEFGSDCILLSSQCQPMPSSRIGCDPSYHTPAKSDTQSPSVPRLQQKTRHEGRIAQAHDRVADQICTAHQQDENSLLMSSDQSGAVRTSQPPRSVARNPPQDLQQSPSTRYLQYGRGMNTCENGNRVLTMAIRGGGIVHSGCRISIVCSCKTYCKVS